MVDGVAALRLFKVVHPLAGKRLAAVEASREMPSISNTQTLTVVEWSF